MAANKWTFEIVYLGQITSVNPTNFHKNKFDWSQKDGEIFYRHKYNGSFVFDKSNGDYDIFWDIERAGKSCDDIIFKAYRCNKLYWKGIFFNRSGKI